ncbi:MAG: hypothetical protein QOG53_2554 [Frankiales bacterium]|jgi:hypothetical protein|nr:hypothetical protein [Frankiales bacterium]
MSTKRWLALVVSVTAISVVASVAAYAAVTSGSGGSEVRKDYRTQDAVATFTGPFTAINASVIPVAIPSGQSRLLTGRFSGESRCTGVANTWCAIRIMVKDTVSGIAVEMEPAVGVDFAFDTVGGDGSEAHAITRFLRVPGGSYNVYVERATTNGGTAFQLDDWAFEVEQNI